MKKLLKVAIILGTMTALSITSFASTPQQNNSAFNQKKNVQMMENRTVGLAKVTGNNVHFREDAGLDAGIIATLSKGTIVELSSSSDVYADGMYWRCVGYNGNWGYIARQYLETIPE